MSAARLSMLALAAVALVAGGCSKNAAPPAPPAALSSPPAQTTTSLEMQARQLGPDLPLLPAGILQAVRPVAVTRAVYEFAARHPEVMHYIPCFCGCENGGHKGNHDCFVAGRDASGRVTAWDGHGIGCAVCIDVGQQAMQMHNSGASVATIREAVERRYAGAPHHTPTPAPPRGGAND